MSYPTKYPQKNSSPSPATQISMLTLKGCVDNEMLRKMSRRWLSIFWFTVGIICLISLRLARGCLLLMRRLGEARSLRDGRWANLKRWDGMRVVQRRRSIAWLYLRSNSCFKKYNNFSSGDCDNCSFASDIGGVNYPRIPLRFTPQSQGGSRESLPHQLELVSLEKAYHYWKANFLRIQRGTEQFGKLQLMNFRHLWKAIMATNLRCSTFVYLLWSTINIPAMLALVKVEMTPDIKADKANFAIWPLLPGANWLKTPIWIPTELIFPNPHTA